MSSGLLAAKALAHLWELVRAEEAPGAKRLPSWQPPLRSALVAIHLREKDAEKMWETFCGGPVDLRLWDKEEIVFKQELVKLRLEWKAKRNFMKLLATLG